MVRGRMPALFFFLQSLIGETWSTAVNSHDPITTLKQVDRTHCLFGQCRHGTVTQMVYPRGAILYNEGTPSEGLYCLHEGRVAISRRDRSGILRVAAIAEPGDLLGTSCLLPNSLHTSTVMALQFSRVCVVSRPVLMAALATDSALVERLLQGMCLRLDQVESYLHTDMRGEK